MMAENARSFKDHRAMELIMSSPDPSTHKHIGRGVRNFDSAASDREKQNAVLSGNYAKFTQNPAMKLNFLSIGNKRLADASPLDPVWGIGLRADDPGANDPRQWRGKHFLGETLPAIRKAIRDNESGSANPASRGRIRNPAGNTGIHEISSVPQSCSFSAASAGQDPLSQFSTFFSDAPANQSQEDLEIASGVGPGPALPERGPCLVGGTVTLDDVSFTTKIAIHSGEDAIAPYKAWCSSILVPPKPSSDVMCWIVCFW